MDGAQSFLVYVDPRPTINLTVKIEGIYNTSTGMVNLSYKYLDPVTLLSPEDPTKGFVPPITQTGKEITWLEYTAQNKPNLTIDIRIENRAWVNFDGVGAYNPTPMNQNYVKRIDASKPVSNLTATVNGTTINVHLSVSGIGGYMVFTSIDNGAYYPVMNGITSTTSFPGTKGHTYWLYSQAIDNVDNVEDAHSSSDATVTIPDVISPFLSRISPNSASVGTEQVNFTANGSGDISTSVIRANGNFLPISYGSGTEFQGVR